MDTNKKYRQWKKNINDKSGCGNTPKKQSYDKEQRKEYQKQWRENNKEKQKEYYQKNKDKWKIYRENKKC